jgi:hypothetical protein
MNTYISFFKLMLFAVLLKPVSAFPVSNELYIGGFDKVHTNFSLKKSTQYCTYIPGTIKDVEDAFAGGTNTELAANIGLILLNNPSYNAFGIVGLSFFAGESATENLLTVCSYYAFP